MLRGAWTPKSEHEPLNYCPVTDVVWGRTTIKPPSICTSLEEHDACSFITEGHKWLLFKRVVIKRSQLCEENVTCFNSFSYCLGLSYSLMPSPLVAERTENTKDKEVWGAHSEGILGDRKVEAILQRTRWKQGLSRGKLAIYDTQSSRV